MSLELPPKDLAEAFDRFEAISAIKAVYDASDRQMVERLLEISKGTLKVDQSVAYRVFYVAAQYLKMSPAVHRVKEHDRTVLGDMKEPIKELLNTQEVEDQTAGGGLGIDVPPGAIAKPRQTPYTSHQVWRCPAP